MDFEISMFMPDFMDSNQSLTDGTVRFDINSYTVPLINFRNTDLNFDTTQLAGNTTFTLETHTIHITDDQIDEITDLFIILFPFNFGIILIKFVEFLMEQETIFYQIL